MCAVPAQTDTCASSTATAPWLSHTMKVVRFGPPEAAGGGGGQ
jgi:hypothetical protein